MLIVGVESIVNIDNINRLFIKDGNYGQPEWYGSNIVCTILDMDYALMYYKDKAEAKRAMRRITDAYAAGKMVHYLDGENK